MISAILNYAMLDSDTAILDSNILLSSLRFTRKHSHSILTLTQTNSIWLKLIHSHLTWWWQPSWIPPSWIQPFCQKKTSLIHSDSTWWLQLCWNLPTSIQPFCIKRTSLIHSDSNRWWQTSWILLSWIQTLPSWIEIPCYLLSNSLKNTLTPLWLWLKLIQSDTNSFFLTQLDDGSHHEFCHVGFSHFAQNSDSNYFNLTQTHSFWLNLMMAAILNSAIMDSAIFHRKKLHSFILTQLDDGSHLEFCHLRFRHCHLGFKHLVIFSQINSKTLSLHLILTQTNSIWLTRWWQPSWILPSWIQSCCTKLWLNLIQSESNSFILTQLDDGSHLEFCHLGFSHLHKKTSLMHSH